MNKKTNFDPNRIKFMLEYKGFGRVTDTELSTMLGYKKDTIERWKRKSPELLDRIGNTGIDFNKLIVFPNENLLIWLNLPNHNKYAWNNHRPKLLTNLEAFFNKTGIKFEDIYENNN